MKKDYRDDIREIKDIMNRSTRFISLSGLSGIAAGIIAIIGLYWAKALVFDTGDYLKFDATLLAPDIQMRLGWISLATLVLAFGAAVFFTTQKNKRQQQRIWDATTRRMLGQFFIPLTTGGIVCLLFLLNGFIGLLPALTLIFYGLALVNAGKHTIREVHYLGLAEITLGILSLIFIPYSLYLWGIGFGVLHMFSGILVKNKYES